MDSALVKLLAGSSRHAVPVRISTLKRSAKRRKGKRKVIKKRRKVSKGKRKRSNKKTKKRLF